ncbi:MAG: GNAT family N-acetyltransferase [Planctomycetota bacterium]
MPIRPATPADVPAILPMVRAICDLHAANDPQRFAVRPDVLDRYSRWLPERAADPRSVFLVATLPSSPSPVGFAVCTIEPEVPIFWVPECGWIHDLYIVPAARRQGLARELVGEITARFTAMGVKQLRLHTATFNDNARHIFAAEGFRPCVVEMLKSL